MIRKLITTTALTAVLFGGVAYAQEGQSERNTTVENPVPFFESTDKRDADYNVDGYLKSVEDLVLASNLMGKSIYDGTSEDSNWVGDVNDVVISHEGRAEAIVIGVGGFLGIGEKLVAVSFDRVYVTERENGEMWLSIDSSEEQLENAPEFDRRIVTGERTLDVDAQEGEAPDTMKYADGQTDERMGDTAEQNETTVIAVAPVEEGEAAADREAMEIAEDMRPAEGDALKEDRETVATAETGAATGTATEMRAVAIDEVSADELIGSTVYGARDENLGEVSDVILEPESKNLQAYIVDVGGFLGIGEKRMAFSIDKLDIKQDANGYLHIVTPYTEEELEQKPEYSEQAYRDNPDSVLVR